ncbi:MAG: ElyC/SanA/YdcF family protein [Candidatus Gracilibacteria bacterium]|nr:ElyC/SanA/YdcF family protein [Candidatus Gracilibacteria bacterium]
MLELVKKIIKVKLYLIALIILLIAGVNLYVLSFSASNIYSSVENIPEGNNVGLILGASIKPNKEPSDILKDRLNVAIEAYNAGKIQNIIVSGDNSQVNYNEPQAMENYLVEAGVKKENIYKDYAGFDTYDSIYRAREIFGIDNLVIFTQEFHLKRAVYIASRLGIDAIGVKTDLHKYVAINYYELREIFSRIKAFVEADILKVETKYNKDVKIEIK